MLFRSTKTPAQFAADNITATLNAQLKSRVVAHVKLHDYFWNNDTATPAEILTALGDKAALFLACAAENLEHLTKLAGLVGKQLSDFLPDSNWQPKAPLTVHADGTVTISETQP